FAVAPELPWRTLCGQVSARDTRARARIALPPWLDPSPQWRPATSGAMSCILSVTVAETPTERGTPRWSRLRGRGREECHKETGGVRFARWRDSTPTSCRESIVGVR